MAYKYRNVHLRRYFSLLCFVRADLMLCRSALSALLRVYSDDNSSDLYVGFPNGLFLRNTVYTYQYIRARSFLFPLNRFWHLILFE